jgi:hypothetical protein
MPSSLKPCDNKDRKHPDNTNQVKFKSLMNRPSGLPENNPEKEQPLMNVPRHFLAKEAEARKAEAFL